MGITSFYIPLLVYIGGVLSCVLSLFLRPEIGLVYLTLFIPLQNVKEKLHIFPLGQDFYIILILALFIGVFTKRKRDAEGILERTSANIPILIYIVITFN